MLAPPRTPLPTRRRRRRGRLAHPPRQRIRDRARPLGPARRPLRARAPARRRGIEGDQALARRAVRRPDLGPDRPRAQPGAIARRDRAGPLRACFRPPSFARRRPARRSRSTPSGSPRLLTAARQGGTLEGRTLFVIDRAGPAGPPGRPADLRLPRAAPRRPDLLDLPRPPRGTSRGSGSRGPSPLATAQQAGPDGAGDGGRPDARARSNRRIEPSHGGRRTLAGMAHPARSGRRGRLVEHRRAGPGGQEAAEAVTSRPGRTSGSNHAVRVPGGPPIERVAPVGRGGLGRRSADFAGWLHRSGPGRGVGPAEGARPGGSRRRPGRRSCPRPGGPWSRTPDAPGRLARGCEVHRAWGEVVATWFRDVEPGERDRSIAAILQASPKPARPSFARALLKGLTPGGGRRRSSISSIGPMARPIGPCSCRSRPAPPWPRSWAGPSREGLGVGSSRRPGHWPGAIAGRAGRDRGRASPSGRTPCRPSPRLAAPARSTRRRPGEGCGRGSPGPLRRGRPRPGLARAGAPAGPGRAGPSGGLAGDSATGPPRISGALWPGPCSPSPPTRVCPTRRSAGVSKACSCRWPLGRPTRPGPRPT